jgi:hypothetical protein
MRPDAWFLATVSIAALLGASSACWLTSSIGALDCEHCGSDASASAEATAQSEASTQSDGSPSQSVDCASSGVLLCENFEAPLDSQKWINTDLLGFATDTLQSIHGKALHVHLATGDDDVRLKANVPLPETTFTRFFVYIPTGPFKTRNAEETLAMVVVPTANYDNLSVRMGGAQRTWGFANGLDKTYPFSTTFTFEFDRWLCVEWEISPNRMKLTVNGRASNLPEQQQTMAAIQELFGWGGAAATEPMDLWMDEIVIAKEPVGCTAFQSR